MTEMIITNTATPTFINKELQNATNKVLKIGATVRKCAFETAYIMAQVDAKECYKEDGFNNVHDWAMKTFGFKKSASYTLLKVGKEYTRVIEDAKGKVKGYGSNLIEDSEDDFTTTQIEKMLPAGHELAVELVEDGQITTDMTCKEIEKVIKAHTKPETENDDGDETENEENENKENSEKEKIVVTDEWGNKYEIPVKVLNKYKI